MQINTERVGPNTERIVVQIESREYEQDYKGELKKAAGKSSFKGFRKGKVPLGFVEKTQGQSILYNLIYNKLNEAMKEHLRESKENYLFDPLPAEEQKAYTFEPADKEDFQFVFDILVAPPLDSFVGWSTDNEYTDYKLEVSDEQIDEKVVEFRRAHSELIDLEKVEENEDKTGVKFEVIVPESNDRPTAEVNIKFLMEELNDSFREKLVGAVPGDEFEGTINEFVKSEFSNNFETSYLTVIREQSDEESEETEVDSGFYDTKMKWSLEEISGVKWPEIDDEFLKKVSGSGDLIKDEEEFREKLKELIARDYTGVSRSIIIKHLRERVIENNQLDIPEKFLKEFVQKDKESPVDEKMKKDTIWSIFATTLAKGKDINITEEDLKTFFANQVISWMQGQGDQSLVMSMVERLMQDESAKSNAVDNIFTGKLSEVVYNSVLKNEVLLSAEDFDELIEKTFPKAENEEE